MANTNSTRDFYVYVHRRATDGRVFYVGKGNGRRAWSVHQRNRYWKFIVAKHGYTVEIVQSNMLEWWAFELECELISSYGRENLCNMTNGGEGPSGWVPSEEFRRNVSIAQTGLKRSKETCEKLSEKAQNRSKEVLLKISKSLTGKPQPWNLGDKNAMRRPDVLASRSGENHHFFGKKRPDITGENHYLYGKKRPEMTGSKHPLSKKVICIENQMKFDSIQCATKWLYTIGFIKAVGSNISECCNGNRNKTYGFHWKYA